MIDQEYKRLEPVIQRLTNLALFGKRIVLKGKENFIKEGPNIIVSNHIGSFKDIAVFFKVVPRPIFFMANKMIFSKDEFNFLIEKHLKRHLKSFGLFLEFIIKPLKSYFVNYISTNVGKVGTIPVNIYRRERSAINICLTYLEEGRAVINLQGKGRVMKKDSDPYVSKFRRGASVLSYNLYKKKGLSVPITPLALYGTQISAFAPSKIKVNVGEPMYIDSYMCDESKETISQFTDVLEGKVKELFSEIR